LSAGKIGSAVKMDAITAIVNFMACTPHIPN